MLLNALLNPEKGGAVLFGIWQGGGVEAQLYRCNGDGSLYWHVMLVIINNHFGEICDDISRDSGWKVAICVQRFCYSECRIGPLL